MDNQSKRIKTKNIDAIIQNGDLLLLKRVVSPKGKSEHEACEIFESEFGILGVYFEEMQSKESFKGISLYNSYKLNGHSKPGYNRIPLIEKIKKEPLKYKILCGISGAWVGQEKIVNALRIWDGFEVHSDWVSKLKKPYLTDWLE